MLWPAVGFPLNEYESQNRDFNPDEEDANSSPAADQPWELVSGHAECFIQRTLLSWMHHHLVIGPGAVLGLGTNHHFIFFLSDFQQIKHVMNIYSIYMNWIATENHFTIYDFLSNIPPSECKRYSSLKLRMVETTKPAS